MKPSPRTFVIRHSSFAVSIALAATAASAMEYGVCEHFFGQYSAYSNRARLMTLMARDGLAWTRCDFDWSAAEPQKGTWSWGGFDGVMDTAWERGIHVLPILCYGSAWGHNSDGDRYVADDDLDEWCLYVTNFVKRYTTRHPGQLTAVEVWNEPDLDNFWSTSDAQYVTLLKRTYAAVKAVAPDVQVLNGGFTASAWGTLSSYYSAESNLDSHFDVFAFHPYHGTKAPTASNGGYTLSGRIDKWKSTIKDQTKPTWLTEIGWYIAGGVSAANQAVYTTNAMRIAESKGVSKYFIYELMDNPLAWNDAERTFGIVNSNLSFKAAYPAVRDYVYKAVHGSTDPYGSHVYLTAGDTWGAANASSFNTAGFWSDSAANNWSAGYAPSAGKDYLVDLGPYDDSALHTPYAANGSTTFGGRSLTLGRVGVRAGNLWHEGSGSAVTVNGLTLNSGRIVPRGGTGPEGQTLAGSIAVASPSAEPFTIEARDAARDYTITATLSGASGTALRGSAVSGGSLNLTFTGSSSAFSGATILDGDRVTGVFAANALLGPGAIVLTNGAALRPATSGLALSTRPLRAPAPTRGVIDVPAGATLTLGCNLAGSFEKTGAGTLVLDYDHLTGSGTIDVAGGTVSCDIDTVRHIRGVSGGTLLYRAEPGSFNRAETIQLFTSDDPVEGAITWPADALADGWAAEAVVKRENGRYVAYIVVSPKREVRLATFNLRVPTLADPSPNDWESRVPRIRAVAERNGFDVWGTEEGLKYQLDAIRAGTGYEYVGGGLADFREEGQYNAIFYKTNRFDVLDVGNFMLSETPDVPGSMSWDSTWPQLATWALFRDRNTGRRFAFYSIHLCSSTAASTTTVSPMAGARGARMALHHALENFAGVPTVISGDFNAVSNWIPSRILSTRMPNATAVSEIPLPATPRVSFHDFGALDHSLGPIDHIHVSGGVTVRRVFIDECLVDGQWASDHSPVVADVLFAENSGAAYSADDTFEDYDLGNGGAELHGWSGEGIVAAGTPAVGDPPGAPVPEAAHTKVLAPGEEVTRSYGYAFGSGGTSLDMLVQVHRHDGDADWRAEYAAEDAASGAHLRLSFDEDGAPWLLHGDAATGAASWTRLGYSAAAVPAGETFPVFADGQWLRVSFDLDYAASSAAAYAQVRLNGHCMLAPEGLRTPGSVGDAATGGSWFRLLPAASIARKANAITFVDAEGIDDLVHRYHDPALAPNFAMGSVTSTNGIPFAWFDAAGVPRIPAGDPDADGFANAAEWRKNTDPLDSRSHPPFPTILIAK